MTYPKYFLSFLRFLGVLGGIACLTSSFAQAASFTNLEAKPHKIIVTEQGERKDITLLANARVTACLQGCFVIFPSGDILPLTGKEDIAVKKDSYQILNQ